MPSDFLSHLEEVRKRILIALAAFAVAAVTSYFFSSPILDFLTRPLTQEHQTTLFFQRPYEAFLVHLKVAGFAGIIFSLPVWMTQIWLFISPGLYAEEKKTLIPLIFISIVLFLIGVLFSYYGIVPLGLKFLLGFQTEGLKPLLSVDSYFSFITGMSLACGICFDLPVLMSGLIVLGVIERESIKRARKVVVVLIFIFAAIITPSPDPFSQVLLAFSLYGLFEFSLWVSSWIKKRKPAGEV